MLHAPHATISSELHLRIAHYLVSFLVLRHSSCHVSGLIFNPAKLPKKHAKKVKRLKSAVSGSQAPSKSSTKIFSKSVTDPTSSSTTESSSSEDDSEYESSEEEEEEKFPLPGPRPQKAMSATRYDAVKAVWFPRNRSPSSQKIREGLKDFWEVVKTIRDRWKRDSDELKTAEEKKQKGEIPLLRERVQNQRDMMKHAMAAAIQHGHRDIVGW